MTEVDAKWMSRALELAEQGRGFVEPNPLVGAVLVRDQQIVGEGCHRRYGLAHAEVEALAAAGDQARGATLYVTLEPCCHHGKTPPCTAALLRAGVGRVVAAMTDPFPQVAGQGIAALRAAGVLVEVGGRETEARRLNAPYVTLIEKGRPYVHAKWAMTLDGKIATRTGAARWISNEACRRRMHGLRGRMDGIVVGIGTVLADDPLLTSRPPGSRTATRVILDSHGRLPAASQLARTAREVPCLVAVGQHVSEARVGELQELGCEVLALPETEGRPGVASLLAELGRRRMTNLLVEGGAGVLGSFLDARAIDEVHVAIAPKLLGGAAALTPITGLGADTPDAALGVAEWSVEQVGSDVLFHGRVR